VAQPPASAPAPPAFGIEPNLAAALRDPIRSLILRELSVGDLSPSQFVAETGGDLSFVARCFRQLESWGYAEVVEERPGSRGGASIEHVYRVVHRGTLDTVCLEGIPRSDKEARSRSILDAYFARVAEAVDAGTIGADYDTHFTWDTIAVDRIAWQQLVGRLDSIRERLSRVAREAAERLASSTAEVIPTTVGLTAFTTPQSVANILKKSHLGIPTDVHRPNEAPIELSPQMAKALSNRWRSRILMEVAACPTSPSQFVQDMGGDPSYVARCFRELAAWGFIEVIEERKGGRRGGGVERVYRSRRRAYFDLETCDALPPFLRVELYSSFQTQYLYRVVEAIEAGAVDAEPDRHLSCRTLLLDREGWEEIRDEMGRVFCWSYQLVRESLDRTGGEPSELIPALLALASFRSPESGG
jgi:hypothetical protein